jgi:hypothetical protein
LVIAIWNPVWGNGSPKLLLAERDKMRLHKIEFDNEWKGSVTVRIPKVAERFNLMAGMNLKVNQEGEVDTDKMDVMGMVGKILPVVKDYIETVELKYYETEVTSADDLEYYNEAIPVLTQVGLFLMQGASLSKN